MGPFDDLVPSAKAPAGSDDPFSDLVPRKADAPIRHMEEPTIIDRILGRVDVKLPQWVDDIAGRGGVMHGVAQGAARPIVGAAQAVANALPDSTGIPAAVNKRIQQVEGQYEQERAGQGRTGFDAAAFTGEVMSPANLLIASRVPLAVSKAARVGQGAAIGGATAGMQPVLDTEDGFWGKKAGQVAAGAVGGAILTPVLAKVGEAVVRRLGAMPGRSSNPDQAIEAALREVGQSLHDIPPAQLQALRSQVQESLSQGRAVDPAAALRKADFDALGMEPTRGQLSRDPVQFAKEMNLRGVHDVGEPLMARFQEQGRALASRLNAPASGAKDAYGAGVQLTESLRNADELMGRHVTGLYKEARASAGKDLDVPLQGLAQDYAQVLDDFGDKVPGAIRSKMAALGLDPAVPSNQRQMFTMERADSLLKVINAHVGNDPATNRALERLRSSLKGAVQSADSSGGPYRPAVQAATERFRLHDAVPALKAASEGGVAPDDFVRRFVVGGKTDDVKGMATILQQSDPAAYQEARAQIADSLRRAAYGENLTGDAGFRASGYGEQLRRLGKDKLAAFFSPAEVDDLFRVGRVGAVIKQAPNGAAVNNSSTASALANLLGRLPGTSPAVALGSTITRGVRDRADVKNALRATVQARPAPLDERQRNWLAYILNGGAIAAGSSGGSRDE